ncbi:LuxR C-terminal-related transcriptional regulator [Pseudoxanthomonas mexicana]
MSKRGRPQFDDVLTPAEWKVVEFVRHGLTNADIARRQGVSPDAVKYHVANVLQKLGMTSRHQIRKWSGIRKASPLSIPRHPMQTLQTPYAIGQVSRTVRDIRKAEAFFRDVVGLEHLYSFGNLAFFNCAGTRLFITQEDELAQDSILYFRVEDIHHAVERLALRGASIVSAPHMIHRHEDGTEEWMAFFNDPDDRPLALMTQVHSVTGEEQT